MKTTPYWGNTARVVARTMWNSVHGGDCESIFQGILRYARSHIKHNKYQPHAILEKTL